MCKLLFRKEFVFIWVQHFIIISIGICILRKSMKRIAWIAFCTCCIILDLSILILSGWRSLVLTLFRRSISWEPPRCCITSVNSKILKSVHMNWNFVSYFYNLHILAFLLQVQAEKISPTVIADTFVIGWSFTHPNIFVNKKWTWKSMLLDINDTSS